jgi:hypothetical protein
MRALNLVVRIIPNSMRGKATGTIHGVTESDVYRANYGEEHASELFRLRLRKKQIKRYRGRAKQRADRGGGRSRK